MDFLPLAAACGSRRFLVRDGLVDVCAAPVEPWQRGRLNEEPRHLPGQRGRLNEEPFRAETLAGAAPGALE